MKKSISTIFLLVMLAARLVADDGSWSSSFSLQGGSIYAEEEESRISLEKELLVFTGAETRAFLYFRNQTYQTITMEVGFPVKQPFHYAELADGAWRIFLGKYGDRGVPEDGLPGIAFFETRPVELTDDSFYPQEVPAIPGLSDFF